MALPAPRDLMIGSYIFFLTESSSLMFLYSLFQLFLGQVGLQGFYSSCDIMGSVRLIVRTSCRATLSPE